MTFTVPDEFTRFLVRKSRRAWSTHEVLDIFKHRYGDAYANALANMLMDTMQSWAPKISKTKKDGHYDKLWEGALAKDKVARSERVPPR